MDEDEDDSTFPDILEGSMTIFKLIDHDNHQTHTPYPCKNKSKYISTITEAERKSEIEHFRQATDALLKTM